MTAPKKPRRPTLAKVAHLAGVSTATASNVLAGKGGAGQETSDRIRRIATELGYQADPGARSLARGSVPKVGVLVSDEVDHAIREYRRFFWINFLDYLIGTCSTEGVITSMANEAQAQELVDSSINVLVIVGSVKGETAQAMTLPFGLPVVGAADQPGVTHPVKVHEIADVVNAALDELESAGRRSIAWLPNGASRHERVWNEEFERQSQRRGMSFVLGQHDDSPESLAKVLPGTSQADALCGQFQNPRVLLDFLKADNRAVPGDVSVLVQSEGILEEATDPALSTLSLRGDLCGEQVAAFAIALTRGEQPESEQFPFGVIRRESTVAP